MIAAVTLIIVIVVVIVVLLILVIVVILVAIAVTLKIISGQPAYGCLMMKYDSASRM